MATLKKALFYTLGRTWLGRDYRVMAVTTEKKRQYFGRWTEDNSATHVSIHDTVGRFKTEADALDHVSKVEAIKAKHRPLIRAADNAADAARNAEQAEITALLNKK